MWVFVKFDKVYMFVIINIFFLVKVVVFKRFLIFDLGLVWYEFLFSIVGKFELGVRGDWFYFWEGVFFFY